MKTITLEIGRTTCDYFGRLLLFMEQATCALHFFPNPYGQVVHNSHLVLRKKTPPKLDIICERYWFLNLALEQHMQLPPTTNNANLSKNPTWLEYEGFICYFDPQHGSGHHRTIMNTFPPRRLLPTGSQTPIEY